MTEDVFQPQPSNVLDLHNFRFEEVVSLLDEFIWSCEQYGYADGAVIHGKGTGTLRNLVHQRLDSHPSVSNFQLDGANWGKTHFVLLKK
jgi:dsDNA-specific endonuclease/ATPase MutS2